MSDPLVGGIVGICSVLVGYLAASLVGMLRDRHRHGPWELVGTHYTPPDPSIGIEGRGPSVHDIARDLIYGFTIVTERCADPDCREVRTRKLVGRTAAGAER